MERIILAAKAKEKELECRRGTMVSVQCSDCLVQVLYVFTSFIAVLLKKKVKFVMYKIHKCHFSEYN
jgi:hypothetical protein